MQVDQDSEGNTVLACPYVEPGYLYPEEVSACIVQQLLEDAVQHTNVPAITKAVITVPAYFDDEQRDATVAAGGRCQPDALLFSSGRETTCCVQPAQQHHLQLWFLLY